MMSVRQPTRWMLLLCAMATAAACTVQPVVRPAPPVTTAVRPLSSPAPFSTTAPVPAFTAAPPLPTPTPTDAVTAPVDPAVQRHLEQAIRSLADSKAGLAIAHLDQALALQPDWIDGYLYRGIALTANIRVDDAIADFDRVIAAQPTRAEAYYLRAWAGYAFVKQSSFDRIRSDVSKALELEPKLADALALQAALDAVAAAQSAQSDPAAAIETALRAQAEMNAAAALDRGAPDGYAIMMDFVVASVLVPDRAKLEAQFAEAQAGKDAAPHAFAAYAKSSIFNMLLASAQPLNGSAMQQPKRDLVTAMELGHARVEELASPNIGPLQLSRLVLIQGSLSLPFALLERIGYGRAPGSYAADPSYPKFVEMIQTYGEHRVMFLTLFYDRPLVFAIDASPDGKQIAALADNGPSFLTLWDTASGKQLHEIKLEPGKHVAPQGSIDYSSDGRQIVVAYFSSGVPIIDSQSGETRRTLVHTDSPVHFARFSPDDHSVVTVDSDGVVRIWDVEAAKETMRLIPENGTAVSSATFSPDGRQVIGGGSKMQIWDAATGERLLSFAGFNPHLQSETGMVQPSLAILGGNLPYYMDIVNFPAVSWDGKLLALPGSRPRIVDARTGEELTELLGHRDGVRCAAFSPDGSRLATASWDGTARIWDVKTGRPLALSGHIGIVVAVAFSPDGRLLATGGSDGAVRVWDAGSGAEVWNGLAVPPP